MILKMKIFIGKLSIFYNKFCTYTDIREASCILCNSDYVWLVGDLTGLRYFTEHTYFHAKSFIIFIKYSFIHSYS